MRRLNMQDEAMLAISDTPDRHAFVMLAHQSLFLCHLTMFHMENHCYQLILEASLPEGIMNEYRRARKFHPEATYFLGNLEQDLFTVPQISIGRRKSFIADIWRGIPYKKEYEDWPWKNQVPIISSIPVSIERVVFFRHFDFNLEHPPKLSYLLFGSGNEAFLTNYQVKEPDFDHVVTLAHKPSWLPEDQLKAGVPINFPLIKGGLHCHNPLPNGVYKANYAGFPHAGHTVEITVAHTEWFCTKVVNAKNPCDNAGCCVAGPPAVERDPQ